MDCSLEIPDGFRQPALELTSSAQRHQGIVEGRVHLQRPFKMHRGLIVSTAIPHCQAQIVFYEEIRWSDCERVLKQSETVTPALNLRVREGSKNQENPQSYSCAEQWRNAPTLGDVR